MKASFKKFITITLTLLALMFSGLGVTPAYAVASFSANPNPWNAGTVAIGDTVLQTIIVTNTGTVTLNGSAVSRIFTGSPDFRSQVTSIVCPFQWQPNATCSVNIQFTPSGSGARSATLSVYISGVFSLEIPLSGTGAGPAVSIDPTSWNFGNQTLNTPSGVKSFTLTNSGTQSLSLGTLSASGNFALSGNTCTGATIASAGTCTFGVTFSPTSTGVKSGSISIPSNAVPSPATVSLSGTGTTSAPAVSLAPASWDFGNQNVGSTSAAKSFTLTNTGTGNLNVGTLTISGEFAFVNGSNTCNGATVAPSDTCTFGVTFSPTSASVKNGSVSIPSNAASSPNSVSLTGTGFVSQAQERAKNGGFNTYAGTSKIPTSWVKSATFTATDGKDTTAKKEGIASVKIIGAAGKIKTLTQTLILSGVSGDTFTFTFWAKGASIPTAGICRAQVSLYNGSTLMLTKAVSCRTGTYATFQKKTLTFNATSAYTKAVIRFTYSKASGTIWFDLISLMK